MTEVPRTPPVRPSVKAGISFRGSVMRYAEMESTGARLRLLRLGSCNFDFDTTAAIESNEPDDAVQTLAEAISDIFDGTAAEEIGIALEPRQCYSFYTPIPADASEDELRDQILKELTIAADNETPLYVASEEINSGNEEGGDSWLHILALPDPVRRRVDQISDALGIEKRIMPSPMAAAALLGRADHLWGVSTRGSAFMISVGCFKTYTEFAVRGPGIRYRTQYSEDAEAQDAVYSCLSLIRRLRIPPGAVDVVLSYGDGANQRGAVDLAHILQADVRSLDPFDLVTVEGSGHANLDSAEYVPCIGAAIDQWA